MNAPQSDSMVNAQIYAYNVLGGPIFSVEEDTVLGFRTKNQVTHDQPWEELLVSDIERIKQELVVECHDDYVGLWAVIWELERACPGISDAEIRLMALRLIGDLLSTGDVRAGDVDENGIFALGRLLWMKLLHESIASGRAWEGSLTLVI